MERLKARRKTAQDMALRARIILALADGLTGKEVAARLGVCEKTAGKWRRSAMNRRISNGRSSNRYCRTSRAVCRGWTIAACSMGFSGGGAPLGRHPGTLRPPDDLLQPLCPLAPDRRVGPNFRSNLGGLRPRSANDSSFIRVHQHGGNVKTGGRTPSLGTTLEPEAWGARGAG